MEGWGLVAFKKVDFYFSFASIHPIPIQQELKEPYLPLQKESTSTRNTECIKDLLDQ